MTTLSATDARKNLFELIKGASSRHEIYRIRHKDGDAVLMSEAEFESLLETLGLLSSPGFREDFEKSRQQAARGETKSFLEVFGEDQ